jgi:hypothetical protein
MISFDQSLLLYPCRLCARYRGNDAEARKLNEPYDSGRPKCVRILLPRVQVCSTKNSVSRGIYTPDSDPHGFVTGKRRANRILTAEARLSVDLI